MTVKPQQRLLRDVFRVVPVADHVPLRPFMAAVYAAPALVMFMLFPPHPPNGVAQPGPEQELVRRASSEAFESLATERSELEGRRESARAELAELEARAEALRRGVHEPPLGDRTTWASGSRKPQTRISQAITVELMSSV